MGEAEDKASAAGGPAARRRLAPWKKALLGVSCLLMLAGAGMHGYAHFRGPPEAAEPTGADPVRPPTPGFLPASQPALRAEGDAAEPTPPLVLEDFSPALFRLGLGFFAGFCIAFALRTFLKLSILAVGLALLVVAGLQFAGLIDTDWAAIHKHYDALVGWLADQTASFRRFLTGYLPSSAAGALGLLAGFKKR